MTNADSIKARLKNYAVETGHTFQEALIYYGIERTIYRISVSKYSEHFILKGGILLYAMFNRSYERATTDIDFLARRISNSGEEMKAVFKNILSQDIDDALNFDIDSIVIEDISELREYHGLHLSVNGYIDRTKIPVGIDIGFGDIVYPDAVKIDFPIILDMDAPKVNAYSIESAVAEKLEAIIKNGYLNSRYKDFYDLYVLSMKYGFDYLKLKNAIIETFENRKTNMSMNAAAFGEEFLNDPVHITRWNSFLKKKKALINVSMKDTITRIIVFVGPLFEEMNLVMWNPEKGNWE